MEGSPPNAIVEIKRKYNRPSARQEKKQQDGDWQKGQFEDLDDIETMMGIRYMLYFCRFLGIYMPKTKRILYIGWSLFINMLATVYVPVALFINLLSMSGGEIAIGHLLTSLQAAINDIACATKIISMAFLLPKLLSCAPILERLDNRCRTKEEREIIRDSIHQGNRIVVLFAICYCCYTSSTAISALIFHRLPYNIYNPLLDYQVSNLHFYLAVFLETFMANLAISQEVVSDSYSVIYVHILRTHLNILCKRIENLNNDATKSLETNLEELKICITDHQHIIEIYNIVAPIISTTTFVQFTVTAIILCVTLINILIFATDFPSIVASCFYVLAVVVEIFPLCYCAQCLMDESNRLQNVLFHSNWVDQDVRYRKMLIFFIHRSQRTVEFTAGKFFPITLNSFLSIAKFSFSLYTFINQMGLKEKLLDK